MTFEKRAHAILKDSIKSAIYIDDNALPFYEEKKEGIDEHQLSLDLYTNFKKSGVSLEVFKYNIGDKDDEDNLNFITDNRDLVILDWNLNGKDGELESLQILKKIVDTKHIHFCTLYTIAPNLDIVLRNLLCFFSGMNEDEFKNVKENCENVFGKDFNYEKFHQLNLNRNKPDSKRLIGEIIKDHRDKLNELKDELGLPDIKCAIIRASVANLLENIHYPNEAFDCPTFIDSEKNLVVINNTVITILKKSENKADQLLVNFFNHIVENEESFNQLLGVELYNALFRNSVIINDDIMSFSKNALLHHRNKLKEEELGYFFKSFMDEILLEKIAMSIRDRDSLLLNDEFLDTIEISDTSKPSEKELQRMNVFYNSLVLDKRNKILNFGDVFKIEGEEKYLMCITPLCDCLRPQPKTKSNFYFVDGENINLTEALKLGDTAFISYLDNNINIKWTNKNNSEYGPLYIKPWQYKVLEGQNTISHDNKINVYYLNREGIKKHKVLNYLGTIRPNYTQRIANHAFSYPIRVGVDFVKI